MKTRSVAVKLCSILILALLSSCVSRQEIAYFQNIESLVKEGSSSSNNTKIKSNDLLNITVSAADLTVVRPYNLLIEARPSINGTQNINNTQQVGYLVDNEGNIEFPELGKIHVAGLTRQELNEKLVAAISKDVKNPIVNVSIQNFKITVLGEVTKPGAYPISGERVTLPEALGLAGDLTIFGRRDNVLVIREENNQKEYKYIDITNVDFLDSDYYYLQQNDVVYVEPNKAQIQGSSFNRNTGLYVSVASLLISVLVIIFR